MSQGLSNQESFLFQRPELLNSSLLLIKDRVMDNDIEVKIKDTYL